MKKYLTYTRWNILRSEIERFTDSDVRLEAVEDWKCEKPVVFEVNWSCFGGTSVEETKAFTKKLELVTSIAEALNKCELQIVYEDDDEIKTSEDCRLMRDRVKYTLESGAVCLMIEGFVQVR